MPLTLHPRVAPPGRIRIWVGAFEAVTAPGLQWKLDDTPVVPTVLRPLQSIRPAAFVGAAVPRAFSGVYEFPGLAANTPYTVTASSNGETVSLRVRTLPAAVTSSPGEWFNILLVSCFHWAEDKVGLAGEIVSRIPPVYRPHLSLLMGDQVYLDLPTLQDFADDVAWLENKFEIDYMRNWRGPTGYAKVLDAAPSVAMADDHEYWNNFPFRSAFIQNSLTEDGRRRWRTAALTLYEGFQLQAPATSGESAIIDVPPLSIFMSDMRTFRSEDREHVWRPQDLTRFVTWVDRVIANKSFGVLVTGQSLLSSPVTDLQGQVADFELSNFKDYPIIIQHLNRLVNEGREALCLTGDVHWGRIAEAMSRTDSTRKFYEVISSPASLVTTVGADQWADVKSWIGGLFGKRNPWPRHAEPEKVVDFFTDGSNPKAYSCAGYHRQKGNHVAVLSFRRVGFGLDWRVTYFPIHPDVRLCTPVEVNMPRLRAV